MTRKIPINEFAEALSDTSTTTVSQLYDWLECTQNYSEMILNVNMIWSKEIERKTVIKG